MNVPIKHEYKPYPKEFIQYTEPYRTGSVVHIKPSFTAVERLHEGKTGIIAKVIRMHDYANHVTQFLYYVLIGSDEYPYAHPEVEQHD